MLKLYVNREPLYNRAWGGGNMFVKALYTYAKDFGVEIIRASDRSTEPDVVLCIGLGPDPTTNAPGIESLAQYQMIREYQLGKPCPIILRCNENDARKGTLDVDHMWFQASAYCDGIVYVSDYLNRYHNDGDHGIHHKRSRVIINGVDRDVFKPADAIENNKNNIVTHHWSDNPLKGFDIYEALDEWVGKNSEQYTFTYIGRHRGTFKNTKIIGPLHGKTLGDELGKYDVYVSASRAEPGPNHVLEAIACGLPTFVKRDGGAGTEFIGEDKRLMYDDFDELVEKLSASSWTIPDPNILIDWSTCIERYCTFVKEIYASVTSNT